MSRTSWGFVGTSLVIVLLPFLFHFVLKPWDGSLGQILGLIVLLSALCVSIHGVVKYRVTGS